MIDVKLNSSSEISFKLNIEGNNKKAPEARLVIKMNDASSLILNARIQEDKIKVDIPPLKSFKENFNGDVIPCHLEVIVDDNYFIPWENNINLTQPLSVTTESEFESEEPIQEIKKKPEVKISMSSIEEKDDDVLEKKEPIVEDSMREVKEVEKPIEDVKEEDLPNENRFVEMHEKDIEDIEEKASTKTAKCPTCGGEYLVATGYCVKCKKKVKKEEDESLDDNDLIEDEEKNNFIFTEDKIKKDFAEGKMSADEYITQLLKSKESK